jgi:hypothetical protein
MGLDQVVIVEGEHELTWTGRKLVYQGCNHSIEGRLCQRVKQREDLLTSPFVHPINRRDDIAPEAHRVVVVPIQREPGDRSFAAPGPTGKQHGLAEPGWGADQDQFAGSCLLQALDKVGARQEIRADSWNVKLRS